MCRGPRGQPAKTRLRSTLSGIKLDSSEHALDTDRIAGSKENGEIGVDGGREPVPQFLRDGRFGAHEAVVTVAVRGHRFIHDRMPC